MGLQTEGTTGRSDDLGGRAGEARESGQTLALTVAKEAAEAANVAKNQFLATMSHELRTPMNAILGMAQLLLMPDISEAERRHFAQTILGSGQSLLMLLNDILDFSKIEAGKLDLVPSDIDPARFVVEVMSTFATMASDKGLAVEARWLGTPGQRYRADPVRLRQMLSNLICNAIKFTAQGFVRIEACEVERDADVALLKFTVADSGIGVAPDKASGLFQRFSQGDSSITREYGGTGLGLSIVRTLAQLMGGEVGFDSEPGHGARFWFTLRAEIPRADDRPPAGRAGDTLPEPWPVAGLSGRILVVEDMPDNRLLFEAQLWRRGLRPAVVNNGEEAVAAVTRGEPPDLILMDVQMPVMDGIEATRRIRTWEAENGLPRRPIIAITAHAFADDRAKCLAAGMDDFFTKPIAAGAIDACLARWLPKKPAPGAPAARPDGTRVTALIDEILPLLAADNYDAIVRYRELQATVAGTGAAAEIEEIGRLLDEFRFASATARLQQLAASQERAP